MEHVLSDTKLEERTLLNGYCNDSGGKKYEGLYWTDKTEGKEQL